MSQATTPWILSVAFLLIIDQSTSAQLPVHYDIAVTLDDHRHVLTGETTIHYTNQSDDTLHALVIHLYPNAYSSTSTAFARQQRQFGILDFHFAEDWERGRIYDLDIRINSQPVPWSLDPGHPDLARIVLTEALGPGETIILHTPFSVQIPRSFSRLGRVGQSYQVTQWFPKVARYQDGRWFGQPYLDQGEFYSDFAAYAVSITLPANYIVAATGTLQNEDETAWLDSLALAGNPPRSGMPPSGADTKTLRFVARDVHDFAWFADKRFAVRKSTTRIGNRTIACYAFFTDYAADLWENATTYIEDALQFYSEYVGPYPYDRMTAVQAPLSRGGGMEYPMITLIGSDYTAFSLDQVIAHEVGHNWFYGVLASNEREHPWMDEGINSMYEYLYLLDKYGRRGDNMVAGIVERPNALSDPQLLMQQMHRKGTLQSPGLSSEEMTPHNYLLGAYIKPALSFWMLRAKLGAERFDSAMQTYFDRWKFKHPGPNDVRAIFEGHCDCDLGWLFDDLLDTPSLIDYAIDAYDAQTRSLTIRNRGEIAAPVQVLQLLADSVVGEQWLEGFDGARVVTLGAERFDRIQVYDPGFSLDANPSDNVMFFAGRGVSSRRIRVGLGIQRRDLGVRPLSVAPVTGWNNYDKVMLGVAVSNLHWPAGKLLWIAAPMYATNSRQLAGIGDIRYQHHATGRHLRWEFGVGARTFSYLQDRHYDFFDRYTKVAPRVSLAMGEGDPFSTKSQRLAYRAVFIDQRYGQGIDFDNVIWERRRRSYLVNEVSFSVRDDDVLRPWNATATVSQGRGFVRLTADVAQSVVFDSRGKSLDLRGFAGWLPHYDNPRANVSLQFSGTASTGFFARDFTHDALLLGRTTRSGFVSHQLFHKDAGLKTLYTGGISESWMVAAGVSTDTPLPLPVRPYVDVVISPDLFEEKTTLNYSGGLALVLLKDVIEVYFPLFESREIRESLTYLTRKSVLQRTSFMINFAALHPFGILDD